MTPVNARDPQSGVVYPFTDPAQLNDAIVNHQFVPVRSDGTAYRVQIFEGGYLFDGMPLNVIMDGFWYAGQQEALASYWTAGTIPTPSSAALSLPVEAMPTQLAAQTQAYVDSQDDILGLPWYVWAGAAAAYLLL
jgi:hypothetical protein